LKRGPRRPSSIPLIVLLALVAGLVTRPARAAEPPAIPEPPPFPAAKERAPREIVFEGTLQEASAGMGGWRDGLALLEVRSRNDGLTITTSNNPGYTTSFEAAVLFSLVGPFLVGLQYDRPTGASEFDVRENTGFGGSAEYETRAQATSNAWLLVGRWMLPGARRGVRPMLQAGAGVGSAQLEFTTPSGGAEGKGHGFVGTLESGLQVGDGSLRFAMNVGWRFHRVPLSYSRLRGTSQPGVQRFYFDFDDETRDFVTGRDVDLSGAFGRIGVVLVRPR
jgi:hypothetical protein